jgi:hypothetical protein
MVLGENLGVACLFLVFLEENLYGEGVAFILISCRSLEFWAKF